MSASPAYERRLANGILPRPETMRQRLVDDGDAGRPRTIRGPKLPAPKHSHADRCEIVRPHPVLGDVHVLARRRRIARNSQRARIASTFEWHEVREAGTCDARQRRHPFPQRLVEQDSTRLGVSRGAGVERRQRRRCCRRCPCLPPPGALRCEGTGPRRRVRPDTAQVERRPVRAATTRDASLTSQPHDSSTSPACSPRATCSAGTRPTIAVVASIKSHTNANVRMSISGGAGASAPCVPTRSPDLGPRPVRVLHRAVW